MTHCAKCGAELVGSKKFCTACGTPATSPRATTGAVPSSTPEAGASLGDEKAKVGPPIDPLASTVMPGQERPAYGPPPAPARVGSHPPPASSLPPAQVSPLAVSNVVSQRNAFADATPPAASVRLASVPPPADALASTVPVADSAKSRGVPATAAMPSVPAAPAGPSGSPGSVPPAAPEPRAKDRTQLMGAFGRPPPARSPAVVGPTAPQPPPQASARPGAAFPPVTPDPYGSGAVPVPHASGPVSHAPQQAAPPYPVSPQAAAYGHAVGPWGFAPGTRVQVAWSDGRRYPGTVQQTSGTQHLVVFPDGQQHWVDLPYLSPG